MKGRAAGGYADEINFESRRMATAGETGLINDRNAITMFDENAALDVCSRVTVYTLLNHILED